MCICMWVLEHAGFVAEVDPCDSQLSVALGDGLVSFILEIRKTMKYLTAEPVITKELILLSGCLITVEMISLTDS